MRQLLPMEGRARERERQESLTNGREADTLIQRVRYRPRGIEDILVARLIRLEGIRMGTVTKVKARPSVMALYDGTRSHRTRIRETVRHHPQSRGEGDTRTQGTIEIHVERPVILEDSLRYLHLAL